MTPEPIRAVIYSRISDDRDGGGHGVARQIEACEERARREGWTLVAPALRDDSMSAWRSGVVRPAYQSLLRMVRQREVDVVVVWQLSRLWRGRVERATGIDVFRSAEVRLACVQGSDLDFSTAMGRGMAAMLGEMDTMESDIKSERICAQKAQAAEQGRFRGGRRPFGFEPDGVTVREDEAVLIREATRAILSGRSLRGVAREWNDRGARTSTEGPWNPPKVRRVLLRPRNAGLVNTGHVEDHNVEIIGPAQWPAIVDREEFDALYRMLTSESRRRPPGWSDLKWFGSSMYRCGREGCGAVMHSGSMGRAGRSLKVYRCSDQGHLMIMATKTDEYVRAVVAQMVRDPRVVAGLSAGGAGGGAGAQALMQADRERRAVLLRRIEQTDADYDEDLIDARRHRVKVDKLTAELEAISARLAESVEASVVSPVLSAVDPGAAFLSAPLDVQRALTRSLLTVEVMPAAYRGQAWTSQRLRLTPVAVSDTDAESEPRR